MLLVGLLTVQRGSGFQHWILRDEEIQLGSGLQNTLFSSTFSATPCTDRLWEAGSPGAAGGTRKAGWDKPYPPVSARRLWCPATL